MLRRTPVARRYAFRHPLVRRTVYEGAGEAWRLDAHARAAAALASRPGSIGARAHHLERCAGPGDADAAAVLEQAAHQAAARAPAVAATLFAAALRVLPEQSGEDGDRRLGLLVSLASALSATGRLAEALETLLASLRLVSPDRVDLRVRLIAACASCENTLGRHEAAHARLLRALADAARRGLAPRSSRSSSPPMRSSTRTSRRWSAGPRRPRGRSRRSTTAGLRAITDALVCFAAYNVGRPQDAETARRTAAAGLDALPDEELAARLDLPYYLGFAEYFCECYGDAVRHFKRGIAVARVVGHSRFVVFMMVGLAQALERLGRLEEALGVAEAAVESARLSGNPQAVGFALVAEAWTAAEVGDVEHARAAAEEAVAILEGLDESVLTRATHAHVGVIWLEIGDAGTLRGAAARRGPARPPADRAGPARLALRRARPRRARPRRPRRRRRVGRTERGDGGRAWSCRSPRRGRCTRARSSRWTPATRPAGPRSRCAPPSARTRCARRCRRRAAGRSPASRSPRPATAKRASASSSAPRPSSAPATPSATATRSRATCAASATASPRAGAASTAARRSAT